MKKRTSQIVASCVAISIITVTPGLSHAAIPKTIEIQKTMPTHVKKSYEAIQNLLPDLESLKPSSVRLVPSDDFQKENTWLVHASGGTKQSNSASVEINDKTGEILSLSISQPANQSKAEAISAEKAKQSAQEFVSEMMGQKLATYRQEQLTIPNSQNGSQSVTFTRLINGIPFDNDKIIVQVSNEEKVISVNRTTKFDQDIQSKQFPDPTKVITHEKAQKAVQKNASLSLVVNSAQAQLGDKDNTVSNTVDESQPVLKYVAKYIPIIDASTGKEVEGYGKRIERDSKYSVSGKGEIPILGNQQEAEKIIAEMGLSTAKNTFSEGTGFYQWKSEDGKHQIVLQFDPISKKLSQVSTIQNKPTESTDEKLLREQEAIGKALSFLDNYVDSKQKNLQLYSVSTNEEAVPDWVDQEKLQTAIAKPDVYYLLFRVVDNNIPVENSAYRVSIDAKTGAITGFTFQPLHTPVTSNLQMNRILSTDKATDQFVKNLEMELVYVWESYQDQKAPAPVLQYRLKGYDKNAYIDAYTGEFIQTSQVK
ncbi:YcdB/YcdC domain-containing protein [Brevibacillus daliensis]|uniref:YcdB/YcdC domain-containing protein n=1 Tax=Brevibacillus daliensis TaxID=2892995 RepID=UPI001E5DF1B3|nr:YcdB/YcdC domain-containing protein [Brevibacillus daliensis]